MLFIYMSYVQVFTSERSDEQQSTIAGGRKNLIANKSPVGMYGTSFAQ